MKKLTNSFQEMDIEVIPSAANFLTLVFDNEDEATSFNESMLQNGIILRHLAGWGLPNCVRVTIGTEEENECLIKSVLNVLSPA